MSSNNFWANCGKTNESWNLGWDPPPPKNAFQRKMGLSFTIPLPTQEGMKDDFPRNIHDRLFRNVFSNPSEAAALLAAALPAEIAEQIDWRTLTPVPGTFVGPDLRQSETDLLFDVALLGGGEAAPRLYVLLEHQSSPDPRMARRMDECTAVTTGMRWRYPTGMCWRRTTMKD